MRSQGSRLNPVKRTSTAPRLNQRIADEARFFKAWFGNPVLTGAVSPSGRGLSRMMASYVDPASDGLVIELGPGTGPVTQALLERGVAPERLVLVEFDPAFCKLLRQRFPDCRVTRGDAYDLPATLADLRGQKVAAIVSSLPLLTRPEPVRKALLAQAFDMMGPGGRFIQFTYGMVSPLALRGQTGAKPALVGQPSPPVWLNLPPARVWVYRRAGEPAPARDPARGDALLLTLRHRARRLRANLFGARQ